MRLLSSHCSNPSFSPSPQVVAWQTDCGSGTCLVQACPASSVQVALQPSPTVTLPSSHCSLPAMIPSPHFLAMHFAPGVGHCQPVSTAQVDEHPSPDTALPSSQVSAPVTFLSPHTTVEMQGMPGVGHT